MMLVGQQNLNGHDTYLVLVVWLAIAGVVWDMSKPQFLQSQEKISWRKI
jgi:hypothetical protein